MKKPAELIVVRHGKSVVDTAGSVSAREFGDLLKTYDTSGVHENYLPPQTLIEKVSSCAFSVCSDLKRSTHSAKLLGIKSPSMVSPLYRECKMPYTDWKYPRLPKSVWPVIFRLFQLLGYAPHAESYQEAKQRSHACAAELQNLAKIHGCVVYVGHGVLIWLLHRQLIRLGWQGPEKSVRENWGFGVYRYKEKS